MATVIKEKKLSLHTLTLKDDGILYVHVSEEREEMIEDIKKAVEAIGEMTDHKKVPSFYTYDEFSLPNKDIREYYAKASSNHYSTADAFLVPTIAFKLIGNVYLKINKPERPTQLFTNEDEAIAWLKNFL